jgi:outer membrane lipoprotein SlyB
MYSKLILSFLGALVLFQLGCSSFVQVYGPDLLGQPQSFTKGKIVSARDVQIKWKDSKKEPDRVVDVVSTATEFVIEQDAGEPFLFVQFNAEQLKAGDRILLLKETDKTRIVRDRATK